MSACSAFGCVHAAEDLAHQHDELERALIADAVEDAIGVLARLQHAFVTQDREVLRDIALRGADGIDDFLHALLSVAEYAEDLEAQGVGDGLERAGRCFDVLMAVDEREDVILVHDRGGAGKTLV